MRGGRTLGNVLCADVQHGIIQSSSHQELQTQIVHSLAVTVSLALLGLVPIRDQTVPKGKTCGRVRCNLIAIEHAPSQGRFHMADNFLLEAILVAEAGYLVFFPGLTLGLGDRCYTSRQNSWVNRLRMRIPCCDLYVIGVHR